MDFFEVVKIRRSIREFDSRMVSRSVIESCLNAARLAPSAINSQSWRFLVVRSPKKRRHLAEAGFNQPCLVSAPLITVLLGDRGFDKKRLRRAKELTDVGALTQENIEIVEKNYTKASESKENQHHRILANCMLAGEHYVLAAAALGLGTCWVMLFDQEKVSSILKLDEKNNFPIALLPTGFAAASDIPPRPRYALSKVAWDEKPFTPWTEELAEWDDSDS